MRGRLDGQSGCRVDKGKIRGMFEVSHRGGWSYIPFFENDNDTCKRISQ